ncbi:MAG: Crp/Fnr family transcriptional regulator [Gammaproteobacteria bacterium]|nr:Crp/Fnr family transcriptional regulator [Gammaproteobacteria bacterium]MBT6702857.1 Crp/Fnr family transcriptional regulator [Gammaproteobacteria bacterium]
MDIRTQTRKTCNNMESLLRQNPLFGRLDSQQLDEMCSYSKIVKLTEGEVLFTHGDTAYNFYFVFDGLIKLYRQSPSGQEKIFELEKSGQIFAEALMFYEQTNYPVSAAAMKNSTVVAISTRKFLNILNKSSDTCLLIMGDLSRRMHELINEIDKLSSLTGRNRVATYLLDQSMNKGLHFKLEIPKNAIASMLSLQPETFSRLLNELSKKQVIEVKESYIKIIDQDVLRNIGGVI